MQKTIEEIYQKKTQLEHILLRPDTYIGSIEHDRQQLWVYDSETQKFEFKWIQYVPGLYKIFGKSPLSPPFFAQPQLCCPNSLFATNFSAMFVQMRS